MQDNFVKLSKLIQQHTLCKEIERTKKTIQQTRNTKQQACNATTYHALYGFMLSTIYRTLIRSTDEQRIFTT